MTGISLRVGGERKAYIFFGPASEPPLLLGHRRRVRSKKSQSIKSTVSQKIIHIPRSSLTEDLTRFVKALQCDQVVGNGLVGDDTIRTDTQVLIIRAQGFFVQAQRGVRIA